jgi:hypothetical protein
MNLIMIGGGVLPFNAISEHENRFVLVRSSDGMEVINKDSFRSGAPSIFEAEEELACVHTGFVMHPP